MHYNIDYTSLSEPEKSAKAIADIIDWMGADRFDTITAGFKERKVSATTFANLVSLAGVQGYPVKVWYNHCYPDALDYDE